MFGATIAIAVDEELSHQPEHDAVVPVGLGALVASPASAYSSAGFGSPSHSSAGGGGSHHDRQLSASSIGSVHIVMPGIDEAGQSISKEGFLHKIGGNVKNWKTRYFRLQPGRLNYYKDGESSDRLGSILLPGATLAVFASDVYLQHPYCFGLTPADGERQYILDADSTAHRSQWIAALQAHMKQRIQTTPHSLREGHLVKQGGTIKNWKKRFCVLSRSALKYYPSFTDLHECLGSVPLGGGFVVKSDEDDGGAASAASSAGAAAASPSSPSSSSAPSGAAQSNNPYGFSLRPNGHARTYMFVTNTRQDRDGWVAALTEIQKRGGV